MGMENNENKIYEMLEVIYNKEAVSNIMYSNGGLREAFITICENFEFIKNNTGFIYMEGQKKDAFDIDFEQILIFNNSDLYIVNFKENNGTSYNKDMKLEIIKNYNINKIEIHNNGVLAFDPVEMNLTVSNKDFTFKKNKQIFPNSLTNFINRLN